MTAIVLEWLAAILWGIGCVIFVRYKQTLRAAISAGMTTIHFLAALAVTGGKELSVWSSLIGAIAGGCCAAVAINSAKARARR